MVPSRVQNGSSKGCRERLSKSKMHIKVEDKEQNGVPCKHATPATVKRQSLELRLPATRSFSRLPSSVQSAPLSTGEVPGERRTQERFDCKLTHACMAALYTRKYDMCYLKWSHGYNTVKFQAPRLHVHFILLMLFFPHPLWFDDRGDVSKPRPLYVPTH